MELVSQQQYHEALDTVERYHNQMRAIFQPAPKVKVKTTDKTDILVWLSTHQCSNRLKNALIKARNKNIKYIEDVTAKNLQKIRYVGEKSVTELEEILQKNL